MFSSASHFFCLFIYSSNLNINQLKVNIPAICLRTDFSVPKSLFNGIIRFSAVHAVSKEETLFKDVFIKFYFTKNKTWI
jgi:hypothetical protein